MKYEINNRASALQIANYKYTVSHKNTPTFLAVTWTNIFWFQYFLA